MEAVRHALGERISLVDDAVLEYLCGTLESALEEQQDDDDTIDAIAPLLEDCLSLDDGAAINELCRTIIRGAREWRAAGAENGAADAAGAMTDLEHSFDAPLKLNDSLAAQDKSINDGLRQEMNVKVNFNASMMKRGTNALIDDESDEMMARRLKMEKRAIKLDKRAMRREKVRSMQNEETLQGLTREPVVLHWQGVRKGSSDIMLRGVSMQLGALELLSDCTLTLAFGRRYGLIGRNGTTAAERALLRPAAPRPRPRQPASPPAALPLVPPLLRHRQDDAAQVPLGQALRRHPPAPAGAAHRAGGAGRRRERAAVRALDRRRAHRAARRGARAAGRARGGGGRRGGERRSRLAPPGGLGAAARDRRGLGARARRRDPERPWV
jgi:hypothetical protein